MNLLITRCLVGMLNWIPYWSQPLLTAMQSSPETTKLSSILVFVHESGKRKEIALRPNTNYDKNKEVVCANKPGFIPSVFGESTGARMVMCWIII